MHGTTTWKECLDDDNIAPVVDDSFIRLDDDGDDVMSRVPLPPFS
jgi:hypothetical protein